MKKLRILVIDDNPANLATAIEQFSDSKKYELTTTSDYMEARKLLYFHVWDNDQKEWRPDPERFDVVLTDLFLPNGKDKEYPFGLVFALYSFKEKVKMVGVITSYSHGDPDYGFASFFGRSFGHMCDGGSKEIEKIGKSKFYFCDNYSHFMNDPERYNGKGPQKKDWKGVLEILLAG